MPRTVSVRSEPLKYVENIRVGPHVFQSDEPTNISGSDAGPNPDELLMAAMGACANITARMYAERKRWPLQESRRL
jgi:putative redox protein